MRHDHYCHDCGKFLYTCMWCAERTDHSIGGLCPECQRKAGEMLVIEFSPNEDAHIRHAKFDTDNSYPDYIAPYALKFTDTLKNLPELTYDDMPAEPYIGINPMSGGRAWKINEAQAQEYAELSQTRDEEKRKKTEERINIEEEHRAAKIAEAIASGRAVPIRRWISPCHENEDGCCGDANTEYALPDGSTETGWVHCLLN